MKFSNIIKHRVDLLSQLNPDRFYVENVRHLFSLPHPVAKFFCEMAVKQKYFTKKYGVICKNEECKRLIASFDLRSQIPKEIKCEQCELLERDHYVFTPINADIIEFYKLIDHK